MLDIKLNVKRKGHQLIIVTLARGGESAHLNLFDV